MAGHGAPPAEAVEGASGLKVAVVAAQWHTQVMDGLLDGARRALADSGVQDATEVRVPGTFELTSALGSANYLLTISPVVAVPEPASWALLIGGFALVGGLLRQRQTRLRYVPQFN